VLDALEMAVGQRRPREVIHHSDQGSQYTSLEHFHPDRNLVSIPTLLWM
jgi:transposase InsO family protein